MEDKRGIAVGLSYLMLIATVVGMVIPITEYVTGYYSYTTTTYSILSTGAGGFAMIVGVVIGITNIVAAHMVYNGDGSKKSLGYFCAIVIMIIYFIAMVAAFITASKYDGVSYGFWIFISEGGLASTCISVLAGVPETSAQTTTQTTNQYSQNQYGQQSGPYGQRTKQYGQQNSQYGQRPQNGQPQYDQYGQKINQYGQPQTGGPYTQSQPSYNGPIVPKTNNQGSALGSGQTSKAGISLSKDEKPEASKSSISLSKEESTISLSKESKQSISLDKNTSSNQNAEHDKEAQEAIKKFKELLDMGFITQEEFEEKKRMIQERK